MEPSRDTETKWRWLCYGVNIDAGDVYEHDGDGNVRALVHGRFSELHYPVRGEDALILLLHRDGWPVGRRHVMGAKRRETARLVHVAARRL
jgi:hypothetical protein